jgi:hypothetical protein
MRAVLLALVGLAASHGPAPAAERWIQLFNGRDLSGWKPKIRGHALGEDPARTFRVENGVLKVSYDQYRQGFGGQFGHLVYQEPFSSYRLRIEYRFVGQQCPGGPAWAFRNSGVMIHGQPPESMGKDQEFPVSIEVQFLGGKEEGERTTANMCSPGTNIVLGGKLTTEHCVQSRSKTFRGDQWVTAEVRVRGSRLIEHLVNGQPVLAYGEPQLDERDADARKLIELGKVEGKSGDRKLLEGGFLYLQAESHPVEFRKVEILPDSGS